MEIYFQSSKLEKLFHSEKKLRGKYGDRTADIIIRRLTALEAADNLRVYCDVDRRCHMLRENRRGQIAIDLVHPQRLILEPHPDSERKTDGGFDFGQTTKVVVIGTIDYHDE